MVILPHLFCNACFGWVELQWNINELCYEFDTEPYAQDRDAIIKVGPYSFLSSNFSTHTHFLNAGWHCDLAASVRIFVQELSHRIEALLTSKLAISWIPVHCILLQGVYIVHFISIVILSRSGSYTPLAHAERRTSNVLERSTFQILFLETSNILKHLSFG